jgi:hypothetical protein
VTLATIPIDPLASIDEGEPPGSHTMKQNPTPPYPSHATDAPVSDNLNIQTAGPRGPALLQDIWLIEKLAHFDREVIPEQRIRRLPAWVRRLPRMTAPNCG